MATPGLPSLDESPVAELDLLRDLLDTATDLVCASTPDGRVTYANRAWQRALGYSVEEAATLRAADFVAQEDFGRYREVARRLVAGEVVEDFEAVLVAKGGRRVACRGRAVPMMADDPAMPGHRVCVGTRAAYRDVTADRRADELRAWLAKTMEATTDFVGIGRPDGRIAYLNRAGRRLVGLRDDDDLSTVLAPQLHPPETIALLVRDAFPVVERGETWHGEGELLAVHGERIPVSMVIVPHPALAGDAMPHFTAVMRDLRERKRDEAALAASEREQRTLLEASADVVIVLDADGTYVRALPTARDLYYEPPEALVGRRLHEVLPAAAADAFLATVRRVVEGGGTETVAYDLDVPRGRVSFEATVSAVGDGTVLWVARDVTARRRAEDALRASETWHRALLDALPLAVYLAEPGPAAPALYVSHGIEALGYPREEWTSSPDLWRRVLHPDDRARVVGEADVAWADGRPKESVYRVVARDGAVRWVHDRAELVSTAGGRVVWRGIMLDITVQREAERALREREARLSLIYNSATDIMALLAVARDDAGAVAGYRYESVNAAYARATGLAQGDVVGRRFGDVLPLAELQRTMPRYDEAVSTREMQRFESELELPTGSLTVETTLSPVLDAAGECTHILASARDITERRRLEERLRQAQKMEAIGQFAGAVAHDFNNMLMVMRGNADGVLGALPPGSPWREPLEDVVGAADRAASLTRQILAFSRRQVLQPARVDLGGAVTAVLRLLEQAVGAQVRIETRLAAGAGSVCADATQITQALLNLCVNARDAMPDGGTLTIATADVTLPRPLAHAHGVVPAGRYGVLTVRDTGTGMDAATFARMFEPFFTTKPRGRGTGLGLATVHGAVEQSGGYVAAESAPGAGTAFALYFPRLPDEAPAPEAAAAPAPEGAAGQRVLLVDDEAAVRRIAQRMLEQGGYAVEAVDGAAAALAALAAAAARGALPDVVVTDVQMPGLSGRELADRVTALYPGVPVVYMSGYTTDHLLQRQVLDATQRIVVKPFRREELLGAVRASVSA